MHACWKGFVLVTGIALLVSCEESLGPSDLPSSLGLSGKPLAAQYTYTFTGDIQGVLQNVPATPSDPFKQVNAAGLSFTFPTSSTGNTTICDQKQPSLTPSVNDWGGYAAAPWDGQMDLNRKKKSSFHLQITGIQSDAAGSINLAVNDVAVEDSNTGVIRFQNVRALISALSYSDTDGGGQPIYDSDDRCVNFTITATRQP